MAGVEGYAAVLAGHGVHRDEVGVDGQGVYRVRDVDWVRPRLQCRVAGLRDVAGTAIGGCCC